jgi:hypothetical protein
VLQGQHRPGLLLGLCREGALIPLIWTLPPSTLAQTSTLSSTVQHKTEQVQKESSEPQKKKKKATHNQANIIHYTLFSKSALRASSRDPGAWHHYISL